MIVLVACEESQVVCIEFRKLGHEAYSCDVLPCSGGHPEWHIRGDVLNVLGNTNCEFGKKDAINFQTQDGTFKILGSDSWDMIIAFPPCTYLSNAGACRLYPKKGELDIDRYSKGLEAKEFFMKIYNADCDKISIENPVSSLVFDMPKCTQEIQPYMFGHPFTKKTRLWLKGLDDLKPTCVVTPTGPYVSSGTGRKDKSKYGESRRGGASKARSKTFSGISEAMAKQWSKSVLTF